MNTWLYRRASYLQCFTHFFDMTFMSECYWNKHMFMNKYMCFSCQIYFLMTVFFSQTESMLTFHLNISKINVELNNENILILV